MRTQYTGPAALQVSAPCGKLLVRFPNSASSMSTERPRSWPSRLAAPLNNVILFERAQRSAAADCRPNPVHLDQRRACGLLRTLRDSTTMARADRVRTPPTHPQHAWILYELSVRTALRITSARSPTPRLLCSLPDEHSYLSVVGVRIQHILSAPLVCKNDCDLDGRTFIDLAAAQIGYENDLLCHFILRLVESGGLYRHAN